MREMLTGVFERLDGCFSLTDPVVEEEVQDLLYDLKSLRGSHLVD